VKLVLQQDDSCKCTNHKTMPRHGDETSAKHGGRVCHEKNPPIAKIPGGKEGVGCKTKLEESKEHQGKLWGENCPSIQKNEGQGRRKNRLGERGV